MDEPSKHPISTHPGRVLGVDPGLNVTGYAVIEPSAAGPVVVEAGVIRPGGPERSLASRLLTLHRGLREVFEAYPPGALALEQVHSHPRFPRSSLLLAHARGVVMLAAAEAGVSVHGYAAARIKKCLTGSGKAPKEQMQYAIQNELGLDALPEPHDVADACAVALCHYQLSDPVRGWLRGGHGS